MMKAEGITAEEFEAHVKLLKGRDLEQLYADSMQALQKLERKQQIRIIAWLCVGANADGFMDRAEWQLIYRIYHKDLNLPLKEIFEVQKDLNRVIWEQSLLAIS
jgi:uncharacterized tellurite resistance protein B-like protein